MLFSLFPLEILVSAKHHCYPFRIIILLGGWTACQGPNQWSHTIWRGSKQQRCFSVMWKEVSWYITDKHSWSASACSLQALGGIFFFFLTLLYVESAQFLKGNMALFISSLYLTLSHGWERICRRCSCRKSNSVTYTCRLLCFPENFFRRLRKWLICC